MNREVVDKKGYLVFDGDCNYYFEISAIILYD